MNLLRGKLEYQGSISAPVDFSYFPYSVPDGCATALEAAEAMDPSFEYWKVAREMRKLQLYDEVLYRPYETLSNGERTKLQLAVLFSKENNFLLIDEPTNHLDIRGRELVSRYLNSKRGFILISHDRAFLDGCVDHILAINRSNIQVCRGNFSTWMENKQRQDAFEQAENEKLKTEISRLEQTAREKAQWSDVAEQRKIGIDRMKVDNVKGYRPLQGAKAAKTMARSKAIQQRQAAAIEEKQSLLKNIERSDTLKIYQTQFHSDRREAGMWAGQLHHPSGRPAGTAGRQRLRQKQHFEADLRTADPLHRRNVAGDGTADLLCKPGYLRPARKLFGFPCGRRSRRKPDAGHPGQAGCFTEPGGQGLVRPECRTEKEAASGSVYLRTGTPARLG